MPCDFVHPVKLTVQMHWDVTAGSMLFFDAERQRFPARCVAMIAETSSGPAARTGGPNGSQGLQPLSDAENDGTLRPRRPVQGPAWRILPEVSYQPISFELALNRDLQIMVSSLGIADPMSDYMGVGVVAGDRGKRSGSCPRRLY